MSQENDPGPLPTAQRNSQGSILEGIDFGGGEAAPHPAEVLFDTGVEIEDLVKKSDIPEKMVPIIAKMLWKAKRYRIQSLTDLISSYLLARIPKDREGRREFMEVVMNTRRANEDDEFAG